MARLDLGTALRAAQLADPGSIPDVVLAVAAELPATDVIVYLVDFAQTSLEPIPARATHPDIPGREEVTGTMAGRAFAEQQVVTVERDGGVRVWVPIVEGS